MIIGHLRGGFNVPELPLEMPDTLLQQRNDTTSRPKNHSQKQAAFIPISLISTG